MLPVSNQVEIKSEKLEIDPGNLPALGIDRLHCGSIDLSAIELKRSTDVEQVDQDMVRNFLCVSADRDRPIL